MVIINHNKDNFNIFKDTNTNPRIFLSNRNGNYLLLSEIPQSRHEGFYYFHNLRMFKIIEDIELPEAGAVTEIDNNLTDFTRRRGLVKERFFVPFFFNSLVYEVSEISKIDIYFDVKESHDNREWGRNYIISNEKNGIILIKFFKTTDAKEDKDDGRKEYELYIAIKADINSYNKIDRWIERKYLTDIERNSYPSSRYVYMPLEFKAGRVVISCSMDKHHAIEECNYIFNNLYRIEKSHEQHLFHTIRKSDTIQDRTQENQRFSGPRKFKEFSREIRIAYECAQNALNSLLVNIQNGEVRILAGFPWFFQIWSRDELISLKAFALLKHYKLCKKIIFSNLDKINYEGRLPNRYPESNLGNADSIGWLFKRVEDCIKIFSKDRILEHIFDKNDMHKIRERLEHAEYLLYKYHTKNNLEYNNSLETWMDTKYDENDDGRAGARIEIQALRLNMYKVLHELTHKNDYREMEKELKRTVRKDFWNGKYLKDGVDDDAIRPNIFIAAYVYPGLLSRREWIKCFNYVLQRLWLEWGGLASIDKKNKKFTSISTGEDTKSYHHGDSWFWVNNLAAIVLHRHDSKKYKKYISKIIEASTDEILWNGAIGCHAEISSALDMKSTGCLNQAWSNAMYIEMVNEIFAKKKTNLKVKNKIKQKA